MTELEKINEYRRGWHDFEDGEPAREDGELYLKGYGEAYQLAVLEDARTSA